MNRTALLGLLFSGILGGCASNVSLDTPTIPEPLLEQIDMIVGVRMPAEFEQYRQWGLDQGFLEVVSGVLVRSSYRAEQVLAKNNVGLP